MCYFKILLPFVPNSPGSITGQPQYYWEYFIIDSWIAVYFGMQIKEKKIMIPLTLFLNPQGTLKALRSTA